MECYNYNCSLRISCLPTSMTRCDRHGCPCRENYTSNCPKLEGYIKERQNKNVEGINFWYEIRTWEN